MPPEVIFWRGKRDSCQELQSSRHGFPFWIKYPLSARKARRECEKKVLFGAPTQGEAGGGVLPSKSDLQKKMLLNRPGLGLGSGLLAERESIPRTCVPFSTVLPVIFLLLGVHILHKQSYSIYRASSPHLWSTIPLHTVSGLSTT